MDDYVGGAGQEVAHQLAHLLQTMDESLNELQQRMARELLQLACDIARQVVRRELINQPQALLPVVREALDMLVNEGRVATAFAPARLVCCRKPFAWHLRPGARAVAGDPCGGAG